LAERLDTAFYILEQVESVINEPGNVASAVVEDSGCDVSNCFAEYAADGFFDVMVLPILLGNK